MSADTWTEQDSIALTAALVARDGHRMPLRGAERVAAIRAMAEAGMTGEEMALRLCTSAVVVNTAARRAGISIPREDLNWVLHVARPSQARGRDRKRAQRAAARSAKAVA